MGLSVTTLPVGLLQVNCYLLWNPDTRRGVVVDPGDEPEVIVAAVERAGFTPLAVLLTHAHVDHIRGVGDICRRFSVPAFVHPDDRELYLSPENALLPWMPAAQDLPDPVHSLPDCGDLDIRLLVTPGHTPGGVCFHAPAATAVFSGDTLFRGSVGRTDLPGGSAADLALSVRTVLYALPDDTCVYPGHEAPTTVGDERRNNPFVRP